MYLRFVLLEKHPDSGVQAGVFEAACALKDSGELTQAEWEEIEALLRWFGDELSTPTRFNRTKSKGHYRRTSRGISWFKDSAAAHVARMHRLTQILRDHGNHVETIKSANPGYAVYEDDHQIVVEPFNDMLKRR